MEGVPVEEVRKVDEEKGDDKIDKLTVENNDDLSQSQNCQKKDEDGGGSSSATPPLLSTTAMTEEEDSVTFHCVSYLGASKIQVSIIIGDYTDYCLVSIIITKLMVLIN